MEQLRTVDVAVLLVYLAAVVAFGCWFVRRSRTPEGFMVAGRSLPGVALRVLLILWMSLSTTPWWPDALGALRSPLHKFLIPVVGTAAIVLAGLLVGRIAGQPR